MRWICSLIIFSVTHCLGQNTLPPIGLWREHLPYQNAIDVTQSENKVYCATPYSLYSIDKKTKETERFSKVSGLSETGISTIQYDESSKKLFIAYSNSNIDILEQNSIGHIPGLKRQTISGDKSIYQFFPYMGLCYLATGLGILVVDPDKLEIKDTWLIGDSGNYVRTYSFTVSNNIFYAATGEGLKQISSGNSNPADFHNWQNLSGTNGLPAAPCKAVVTLQNQVVALEQDTLFIQNGTGWNMLFANGLPVLSVTVSENKLLVCQRAASGESDVIVLNPDGTVQKTIIENGIIAYPEKAISISGSYWIADLYGGLSNWVDGSYERYTLNSPTNIATGDMVVSDNTFYAAAGSVNDSWNYQYNPNGIYKLNDGYWTNYNRYSYSVLDSVLDLVTVLPDPRDKTIWGGSFGGGLVHITDDQTINIFKQNSPIGATIGDPGSYRVSGLAFDAENNLWISNFGSDHPLRVLKSDGTWQSFTVPFYLFTNALSQIVIDDAGQKWIAAPLGNGLIVLNDHQTIDDASDDQWKLFTYGSGAGNLPSGYVLSLAKDKSGFMWVGTTNGIGVFQCPEAVFTTGCEAIWPVIKEGNFANYLFKNQEVRSIAVDGADRKWIATSNGAWLISSAGDSVLAHYTEDNSPLLSNDVKKIAINGSNGEVYFGTSKGICSFRGTATDAAQLPGNVLVYPNPVPPGYSGTIGIRGLPENSIVKITETNGRLVYQARSLGGQAVWNGRDYMGRKASTGIYLVLAEDDNHQQKSVAKIVFISN